VVPSIEIERNFVSSIEIERNFVSSIEIERNFVSSIEIERNFVVLNKEAVRTLSHSPLNMYMVLGLTLVTLFIKCFLCLCL